LHKLLRLKPFKSELGSGKPIRTVLVGRWKPNESLAYLQDRSLGRPRDSLHSSIQTIASGSVLPSRRPSKSGPSTSLNIVLSLRMGTHDGWHAVACALCRENDSLSGMVGTVEEITTRQQSELAQQAMHETLEALVRERTAGLERAVIELKQEVARRQQAESALKASEQRYQSLYEHNPFMYFTLASDGIVLSVNHFGAEQLGYQKEDLIGQSIVQVFDLTNRRTVLERITACVASPYTLLEWETQKIRKDGPGYG
jgi:PAS domain S-box-containing protein